MKRPFQPRHLTVAQQYGALQASSICPGIGRLQARHLRWDFDSRATPLGRAYKIRITYTVGVRPELTVLRPKLSELAGGRRLPHVYRQEPPVLCLYLPGTSEWTPSMFIARTIVPWTALWLFYFEYWLVTDEWKGGGMHPADNGDKNASSSID